MVPVTALWLPILLAAVLVFIVSSIIHMLLPYHRSDFRVVPSEDEVMAELRKFDIPPGDYMIPCAGSPEKMKDPKFQEKCEKGPMVMMTLMPGGGFGMGKSLSLWFTYTLLVGVLCAVLAGPILAPGTGYRIVFHVVGLTAFAAYSLALLQNSIWYRRNWASTFKSVFDGLIYALLTAGIFGWLWP